MGDRADPGTVQNAGASSLLNPDYRVPHLIIEAVSAFALPASNVR
jgi:hypothetical protein